MRVDVIMPQMGESIAEGTMTKWFKHLGETVGRDEPLFEISTDKVDAEIPSPAEGILVEIVVKEGETVPIQTVVALIETETQATVQSVGQPTQPDAKQAWDGAHKKEPASSPFLAPSVSAPEGSPYGVRMTSRLDTSMFPI